MGLLKDITRLELISARAGRCWAGRDVPAPGAPRDPAARYDSLRRARNGRWILFSESASATTVHTVLDDEAARAWLLANGHDLAELAADLAHAAQPPVVWLAPELQMFEQFMGGMRQVIDGLQLGGLIDQAALEQRVMRDLEPLVRACGADRAKLKDTLGEWLGRVLAELAVSA